jgi:hypothetical protein
MKKLFLAIVVAAFTAAVSLPAGAADPKPAADKPAATRPLPFSGKITSVDKTAKTVKVGEKVFQVTATTRIIKDGKAATLDDAKAGEEVGISYREGDDKKLNLVSLRIGAKPAAPATPAPAK